MDRLSPDEHGNLTNSIIDEGDTYVDDEEGADILRAWCSHRVTGDAKRPLTDLKNVGNPCYYD